ncbi:hypothetical protein K7X08_035318 [Anisodus acutangulus]|uniref:Dof zinc finger protein n=1 Tax=Anisodus acutangulus TaxID=402998 RepID=A0A9Q1LH07_9SOLA|nr:hypothetical protein K7X08_035318 [Anisodus acutangulus]
MDTSQWPQCIGVVKGVEVEPSKVVPDQRKPRPQKEQAINCPRCNSTNTKFCYYNNYSLSQPRYFCKTCRRYWTEGGSLRSVPVGGGSRKNKRSNNNNSSSTNSSSTSSSSSSKKLLSDLANPKIINDPHDLNLTYNPIPTTTTTASNFSNFSEFMALPLIHPNSASSFMPNNLYSSSTGLPNLHDLKPSGLDFSLDGFEHNGYESLQGGDHQESAHGAKLFFPMDDLKINVSTANDQFEENRGQPADQSNGFWNGMLGGGGSSW